MRRSYHAAMAVVASIAGIGGLGLAGSSWACGASFQALYEGEVRFEHCYRLDKEPNVPLTQRRECWREWNQFYTYGQTRDRVEYALSRQRALGGELDGATPTTQEGLRDGGVAPTPTLAAPPPTSPFAPPPQLDSAGSRPPAQDAGAAASATAVTPEEVLEMVADGNAPPGQTCLLRCVATWKKCTGNCLQNNARCRTTCDAAFRTCARGCV